MPRDADIPVPTTHLTKEARIQVLLEEYRALYGLLTFRLGAMDRRLDGILAYYLYNAGFAGMMLHAIIRLRNYRYRRPPTDGRPLFEAYSQDST